MWVSNCTSISRFASNGRVNRLAALRPGQPWDGAVGTLIHEGANTRELRSFLLAWIPQPNWRMGKAIYHPASSPSITKHNSRSIK